MSPPTGLIWVAPKRQWRKLLSAWCLGNMSVLKTWQIHKNSTPASVLDMILCLPVVKPSLPRWMDNTWRKTGVFPFRAWSLLDRISAMHELQWLYCVDWGPLQIHLSTNLSCVLGELAGGQSFHVVFLDRLVELAGRSTNNDHLQNLLTLWHRLSDPSIKWLYVILRTHENHQVFEVGVCHTGKRSNQFKNIPFSIKWAARLSPCGTWLDAICQRWWNVSRLFWAFLWNILLGLSA